MTRQSATEASHVADLRDVAEKSVDEARKAFDAFIGAARRTADAVRDAEGSHTDADRMSSRGFEYAEQNVDAAFDLAQKLVRSKDVQEAMQHQAEFVRAQFLAIQAQAKEFGALAQAALKRNSNETSRAFERGTSRALSDEAVSGSSSESAAKQQLRGVTRSTMVWHDSRPTTDAAELSAIKAEIDADNARARARFIESIPGRTRVVPARVAQLDAAQKQAGQRSAFEDQAVSVPWKGDRFYPDFQFGADGHPLPVIATILEALPRRMTPWQKAFWFVSTNPWLDGRVPSETLGEPETVVQAARAERDSVVG